MNESEKRMDPAQKKGGFATVLVEYMEMFVLAVIAVILLFTFCFRLCRVDGPSMNNTLKDGENLIIRDLFYTPKRGDIIVFHQTSELSDYNKPIVKRVIATGGQYVKIDFANNLLYVSDDDVFEESEIVDEGSYAHFENPNGEWKEHNHQPGVYAVPEGHLFVLGDNRNNSLDSRSTIVSFVDERRVLGKVLWRISPLSSFGKVT